MLGCVENWRVLETETLSDHRHLVMHVGDTNEETRKLNGGRKARALWNLDRCDWEVYEEVSGWLAENGPPEGTRQDPDKYAKWVEMIVTSACDASAPRIKDRVKRKSVYWWNSNIATLRAECIKCRRTWTRSRGRKLESEVKELQILYKNARKAMQDAIRDAKKAAWQELIDTIDENPWGRAYRVVVKSLDKK